MYILLENGNIYTCDTYKQKSKWVTENQKSTHMIDMELYNVGIVCLDTNNNIYVNNRKEKLVQLNIQNVQKLFSCGLLYKENSKFKYYDSNGHTHEEIYEEYVDIYFCPPSCPQWFVDKEDTLVKYCNKFQEDINEIKRLSKYDRPIYNCNNIVVYHKYKSKEILEKNFNKKIIDGLIYGDSIIILEDGTVHIKYKKSNEFVKIDGLKLNMGNKLTNICSSYIRNNIKKYEKYVNILPKDIKNLI